jgi:hypothetical protein
MQITRLMKRNVLAAIDVSTMFAARPKFIHVNGMCEL